MRACLKPGPPGNGPLVHHVPFNRNNKAALIRACFDPSNKEITYEKNIHGCNSDNIDTGHNSVYPPPSNIIRGAPAVATRGARARLTGERRNASIRECDSHVEGGARRCVLSCAGRPGYESG